MTKKIDILSTIKTSFRYYFEHCRFMLFITSIPYIIYCCFILHDMNFIDEAGASFFDKVFLSAIPFNTPYYFDPKPYTYAAFNVIITMPFILAAYRYFLLDLEETSKKRPYIRLGKQELIASTILISVQFFFLAIDDVHFLLQLEMASNNSNYLYKTPFTIGKYGIFLTQGLIIASIIFVWPFLATSEKFNISSIPLCISLIRKNIIRVLILSLLIFSPYFIVNFIFGLASDYLATFSLIKISFLYCLKEMIYFFCIFVEVICISLLFISLVEKRN